MGTPYLLQVFCNSSMLGKAGEPNNQLCELFYVRKHWSQELLQICVTFHIHLSFFVRSILPNPIYIYIYVHKTCIGSYCTCRIVNNFSVITVTHLFKIESLYSFDGNPFKSFT